MKHWSVNIVINYEVEAETGEDAIEQAENEFLEDTNPSDDTYINYSWEEE